MQLSVASTLSDPPRETFLSALAGLLMLLWGWRRATVALLAGGVTALAQAPYDFSAACFLAFPVLVFLLDGAAGDAARGRFGRMRPFFAVGWWFGFGCFLANLWWIGNAMLVEVDKHAWALPIATLVLPAFLAIFYGLAAALARPFWNEGLGRIAALAATFALSEWLRVHALSGFPWNSIGMAAMPVPLLMQSVTLIGMVGMNALAVFAFCLPAMFAGRSGRGAALAMLAAIIAFHVGFGFYRMTSASMEDAPEIAVRLVQPSVNQAQKWDPALRDEIFRRMLDLSSSSQEGERPALILWPETSVPFLFQQRPDALAAIDSILADNQVLLAGAVRMEGDAADPAARYYNSVVAIRDTGEIYDAVDKQFLVPLGELVPFEDLLARIGITKLVSLPGGFSAGTSRHAVEVAPGVTALPFICYEVIFPGVALEPDADLILNVTNDGWFGNSPGPYQHLRHAQLRAVEAGRPMLRAANNGITTTIDPFGRLGEALALDGVGVVDARVTLSRASSPVPFAPDLAGWLLAGLLLLGGLVGAVRERRFH